MWSGRSAPRPPWWWGRVAAMHGDGLAAVNGVWFRDGPTAARIAARVSSARVEFGAGGAAISGRGHLYQSDSRSRRDMWRSRCRPSMAAAPRSWSARAISCPAPLVVLTRWRGPFGNPGAARPRHRLRRRAAPAGDRVTLDISPRDDTPGPLPGSVNSQRLVTTVSGRLGEWLELGGGVTEQSASGSGIIRYSTQSASRQRRLLLRIEALD
jgi:hypothetical protein